MQKKRVGPQILVYPMPTVLVGAVVNGKPNYMTVAFCGIMAHNPPSVAIGIKRTRHTMKGIVANDTFSINIPPARLYRKVDQCGLYSGREREKSALFATYYGVLKNAPLIEECPINIECTRTHTLELGSHLLIVGEIVETHVSDSCIVDGKVDPERVDPLVYIPRIRKYYRLGEFVAHAFRVGKESD